MTSVRVYRLGHHEIIPAQSVARAATYARMHMGEKLDILKDGVIVGMKSAGSERIDWINNPSR